MGRLKNRNVRVAAAENALRSGLCKLLVPMMESRGLTPRLLAGFADVPLAQVNKLLCYSSGGEHGGKLHLRTLVRVADALGLDIGIEVRPRDFASETLP